MKPTHEASVTTTISGTLPNGRHLPDRAAVRNIFPACGVRGLTLVATCAAVLLASVPAARAGTWVAPRVVLLAKRCRSSAREDII
jgi:hypothetical protein